MKLKLVVIFGIPAKSLGYHKSVAHWRVGGRLRIDKLASYEYHQVAIGSSCKLPIEGVIYLLMLGLGAVVTTKGTMI